MASERKKIVILGASFAGISTAHYLLKHLIIATKKEDVLEVVLVAPSKTAFARPAAPRALISDDKFPQEQLFGTVEDKFEYAPKGTFRFIQGVATKLDHDARVVSTRHNDGQEEQLEYYALVIATGARATSPLLGYIRDDVFLKEQWALFRKELPSAKSIVIAGGGPSGVEVAGELGEHLNGRAGWFSSKLANPKVPITLLTTDDRILTSLRPSLSTKAEGMLAKVGVTVLTNAKAEVSPAGVGTVDNVAGKATLTLEDGKKLEADLYIQAFGYHPSTSFVGPELLTPNGKVETNTSTLRVNRAGARVYAVGDCSSYSRGGIPNLMASLPLLGSNIKRDILLDLGEDALAPAEKVFVEDKRGAQLVPVGRSMGVAEVMGWSLPSFAVSMIKGRDFFVGQSINWWTGKMMEKEAK